MTLNLSSEGGREILYKLLTKADVFLSNFRPRELEKFELEYDTLSQLNPRLICANLTGYGKRGADKNLPAYEATGYFSRAGVLHVLQMPGSPPSQWPWGLGDNVTGLALACGVMTALFIRERTGVGQEVDVSLLGMGVFAISYDIAASLVTGQDRQPVKREDGSDALFNPYCTKDGRWLWIALFQPDLYWRW
jgi:formyl-CoA transferase